VPALTDAVRLAFYSSQMCLPLGSGSYSPE